MRCKILNWRAVGDQCRGRWDAREGGNAEEDAIVSTVGEHRGVVTANSDSYLHGVQFRTRCRSMSGENDAQLVQPQIANGARVKALAAARPDCSLPGRIDA